MKGITPRILAVRMGWEPDSSEGFGFLGHHPHVVSMFLFLLLLLLLLLILLLLIIHETFPHLLLGHPKVLETASPGKNGPTLQRQTRNPPWGVRVWKSSKTGCNIPKHSIYGGVFIYMCPLNYPKCKQDWEYIAWGGQEAATNPSTSSMYFRIVEFHCLSRPGWMSTHIQRSRVATHAYIAHGNPRSPTMKGRIGS